VSVDGASTSVWLEPVSDAAVANNTMIASATRHDCVKDRKYIVVLVDLRGVLRTVVK
jgi:hypothetical protein